MPCPFGVLMRGFVASLASKPRGLAGGPHKAPPPSTPNTLQHSPAPRLTVGLPLMPLKGVLGSGCWPFPSVLGGSWGIAKHVSINLGNGPQRSSSRPRAPQDLWSPWPEARRRRPKTQIHGQGFTNSLASSPNQFGLSSHLWASPRGEAGQGHWRRGRRASRRLFRGRQHQRSNVACARSLCLSAHRPVDFFRSA